MKKTTAIAPTNIAFVKYMGKDSRGVNFPMNGSISMCLDNLHSTTTVEFSDAFTQDSFELDGNMASEAESKRTLEQIDLIRQMANTDLRAKIVSKNNFGKSRGLSSSASGMAALSVAGAKAAGLDLDTKALSILARHGSGSAARSVPDGFVEWQAPVFADDGTLNEDSYAETIFPAEHWDIADVIAVTKTPSKKISTTQAHGKMQNNWCQIGRQQVIQQKLSDCRQYLAEKDLVQLGPFIEQETLDLHCLFMSAGIVYLQPETIRIMQKIQEWRTENLQAFYTLNTGQDVHVICEGNDAETVCEKLSALSDVEDVILNKPGPGAQLTDEHLF